MIAAALLLVAALGAYAVHYLLYRLDQIEHTMHSIHRAERKQIMALSDDVKALRDLVIPALDEVIAELTKIDALLAAAGDPDVPGAQAAIAEILAKLGAVKVAVDVPEGPAQP